MTFFSFDPSNYLKAIYQPAICNDKKDKGTALFDAIKDEKLTLIYELIKNDADLRATDVDGNTPLHLACKKGLTKVIKKLLDNSARLDINAKNNLGNTPLHEAILYGNLRNFVHLLGHNPDFRIYNDEGDSPLHIASRRGRTEMIQKLLEDPSRLYINDKNYRGNTPLHEAILINQIKASLILINNNSNLRISNYEGTTPLHLACRKGQTGIVNLLLKDPSQFDINAKNDEGNTPLHEAISHEHLNVVKYLLEQKPDLTLANKDGQTPLHVACQKGRIEIVQMLLEDPSRIDVNACDKSNRQPFSNAKDPKIRQLLVNHGADIFKSSELETKTILYNFFGNKNTKVDLRFRSGWPAINATHLLGTICDEWKSDDHFLNKVGKAFKNCVHFNNVKLAKQVRNGHKPIFIHVGWFRHSVYMGFIGDYLCIINRGQKLINKPSFSMYHFDREKMTPEIMKELIDCIATKSKDLFIQQKILDLLNCKKDDVSEEVAIFIKENKIFQPQKRGNCALANAKPLLFFAKLFEKSFSPTREDMEKSYQYYKGFTNFAREYVLQKTDSKRTDFRTCLIRYVLSLFSR